MARLSHYLLVLLLAFSTVTLTAHGVVHADSGMEQCLLCASHAGAGPAAVGEPPAMVFVADHRFSPETTTGPALPVHLAQLPQPRAPPIRS